MKQALRTIAASITALVFLWPLSAKAIVLDGASISADYLYPDVSTSVSTVISCTPDPSCFSVDPFVVGPGVESTVQFSSGGGPRMDVDFSTHRLTLTALVDNEFNASAFNGLLFSLLSGRPFEDNFRVSAPAGLALAVSVSGSDLYVNFASSANQTLLAGDAVTITFVPLPAALQLLLTAVGLTLGVGAYKRKRRHAVTAAA